MPSRASFDLDVDRWLEPTDWIAPGDDALIGIDRTLDGQLNTDDDVFGGNFRWLDVDDDGVFDPRDPAWDAVQL